MWSKHSDMIPVGVFVDYMFVERLQILVNLHSNHAWMSMLSRMVNRLIATTTNSFQSYCTACHHWFIFIRDMTWESAVRLTERHGRQNYSIQATSKQCLSFTQSAGLWSQYCDQSMQHFPYAQYNHHISRTPVFPKLILHNALWAANQVSTSPNPLLLPKKSCLAHCTVTALSRRLFPLH